MNSNRGITTTSLIIYVIAMLIVIGIISSVTSFFYTNILLLEDNSEEFTKFNMYFLQETKKQGNNATIINPNSITFNSGNTFTFENNCIYLNSSKICENVKNFSVQKVNPEEVNNKNVVRVLITIGENIEYSKTTNYVLAE